MLLRYYLHQKGLKASQFADMIDATEMAVSHYLAGKRIPAPVIMRRIYEVTKGKVTANDFYNFPDTKVHRAKTHGTVSAGSNAESGARGSGSGARKEDTCF